VGLHAIESSEDYPDASRQTKLSKHDYSGVLYRQHLAKDVDKELRGPYGVAPIEVKDQAQPYKKRPFWMQAERETALRHVIETYLTRGWIEESSSDWCAQAFLVPKPADPKKPGEKQWRMLVDNRYLDSQTKDDPLPLPLIDN